MAEKDTVVEKVQEPETSESKGKNIGASIKEFFRKKIVQLKRRPMNIAFFVLVVSAIVYLCALGKISQTAITYERVDWIGFCVFVNTLFCILSLLLFMNSFPKREKKPKIVMLVLFFLFVAAMIAFDVLFYVNVTKQLALDAGGDPATLAGYKTYMDPARNCTIAHIVLVAIGAILTATYPLYGKLINKINTRKVIESNEIKEAIDTSVEV